MKKDELVYRVKATIQNFDNAQVSQDVAVRELMPLILGMARALPEPESNNGKTLVLSEAQRYWLRGVMQNPMELEDNECKLKREELFNLLG